VTLGVTLLKRFAPCSHVTYTLFPLQFHTGHGQGCDIRGHTSKTFCALLACDTHFSRSNFTQAMGKAVTLGVTLLKRFVPCSHVTYTLFLLQFHTGHGQGCDIRGHTSKTFCALLACDLHTFPAPISHRPWARL